MRRGSHCLAAPVCGGLRAGAGADGPVQRVRGPVRRRLVVVVAGGAIALVHAPVAAQPRPEALVNAERARESLRSAVAEYRYSRADERRPPVLYRAQVGADGELLINRGSEAGLFYFADGEVNPHGFVHLVLKEGGNTWVHDNDFVQAQLSLPGAGAEGIPPLRSLGLSYLYSYNDVHDTLWWDHGKNPEARAYREYVERGLHVVEADTSHGTITWWIDAQRGWNPIRVTYARDGQVRQESRITLRQYDGVWYPATVAFYRGDADQGAEPHEVVEIRSAEFNRPEHPRMLRPAHIGIESGMAITVIEADDPNTARPLMTWDGEKVVTTAEYSRRWEAGEIQPGPNHLRALAVLEAEAILRALPDDRLVQFGADPESSAHRRREAEWEAYVRAFVRRYQLDEGQTQRAYTILRDCQERANQYLRRRTDDFERLHREARKLLDAASALNGTPTGGDRVRQRAVRMDIRRQHVRLMKPIVDIFDGDLKPRLEKLPTRAQRRAAGEDSPAAPAPAAGG